MNLQSRLELSAGAVEAGGPGSGRHPGVGDDPALLNKFHSFMTKHNLDMGSGEGVANYEHAANFFHHLEEGGKTVMHNFFDHMDKQSGLGKGSRVDHRGNLHMKARRRKRAK
jgi:hypothetical protein